MFSKKRRKQKCLPKTIDSLRNKTYNLVNIKTKETLLSMLAGALLANISKFAVALDQVRIQKEENSTAETTAEA